MQKTPAKDFSVAIVGGGMCGLVWSVTRLNDMYKVQIELGPI